MTDVVESKFYRLADGRLGKIEIYSDDDASSPRDTDTNVTLMFTWNRDYVSPDEYYDIPVSIRDAVNRWRDSRSIDAANVVRYARIFHADSILFIAALSNIGTDGWSVDDSPRPGQSYDGIVVVTGESWTAAHGDVPPPTKTMGALAAAELEEYNSWASGDSYGYVVTVDDDEMDSCWGFIGYRISYDAMMAQARFNFGDGAEEIDEGTYLAGPQVGQVAGTVSGVVDVDRDKERQFNLAATFLPMDPADPNTLPCVEIAGIQVYVYVKDGELVVSQHHDNADPYFRQSPVHKAEPGSRPYNCRYCGQEIRSVPGGNGPTWVHDATGAVAAPNPDN